MEKIEFKNSVIVWTTGKERWIINYNDITMSFLRGIHPYLKRELSTAIKNKIINQLKIIYGEWYLTKLKKIKNYNNLNSNDLKKITTTGKKLGNGRYATVYLYKDYAIKVITNQSKSTNGKIELKILKLLLKNITFEYLSPNIINIYEYIETKNKDYIVLEKLDQTLWSFLNTKPTDKKLKGIILQVLFTIFILQYKFQGFRHNDLKTDNILLDFTPRKKNIYLKIKDNCWVITPDIPLVKIADFDYANIPNIINNPKVKVEYSKTFGCTSLPSKIYDLHIFLNSIYISKNTISKEIVFWIQKQLPESTRGLETINVKYGRLVEPKKWIGKIKTPYYLLNTDFFKIFKSNKCINGVGVWGI
jgi:serine/threonine protein kinase